LEQAEQAMSRLHRIGRLRQWLHRLLEPGPGHGRLSTTVNWVLIGLVVVTLTATVMESVPRLANAYSSWFESIEYAALAAFSLEYLARLWTAVEYPPWRRLGAVQSRLRFALSAAGLVDLAAVLPFWLSF
jgi:voltage-gated potassium channel